MRALPYAKQGRGKPGDPTFGLITGAPAAPSIWLGVQLLKSSRREGGLESAWGFGPITAVENFLFLTTSTA